MCLGRFVVYWYQGWGSNPRPRAYESHALPTELPWQEAAELFKARQRDFFGCGGRTRTANLKVMSLARCHFSTPRRQILIRTSLPVLSVKKQALWISLCHLGNLRNPETIIISHHQNKSSFLTVKSKHPLAGMFLAEKAIASSFLHRPFSWRSSSRLSS